MFPQCGGFGGGVPPGCEFYQARDHCLRPIKPTNQVILETKWDI